jgi:hypothetical protein
MTLDQIRNYINFICTKENRGGTFTPKQINVIFPAASIDMFNKKIEKAQIFAIQNKIALNEVLDSIIELRDFISTIELTLNDFGGHSSLPNDFAYWSSLTTIYNGSTKKIELLSTNEFDARKSNILALEIDKYPICRLISGGVEFLPNNMPNIGEFTYYRIPVTPVYDYYVDVNKNEIYLSPESSHTLGTGEIGSAGQTSGLVTSLTVELDWSPLYHISFCNEVLQKVGINLKDQQISQYVTQAKQEQG